MYYRSRNFGPKGCVLNAGIQFMSYQIGVVRKVVHTFQEMGCPMVKSTNDKRLEYLVTKRKSLTLEEVQEVNQLLLLQLVTLERRIDELYRATNPHQYE